MYMCVLNQRRHVYLCVCAKDVDFVSVSTLFLIRFWNPSDIVVYFTLPTLWYIFFYFISLFTFTYRYFVTYRHSNTKFIIGAVHLLVLLITVTSFLIYLDQLLRSILLTMYIYKAMVITPNFTMLNVWI